MATKKQSVKGLQFTRRFTKEDSSVFDQFTYDASGSQTGETIRHTDGSRDAYSFGIAGKAYASQHVVSDSSGHSVLIEQFHADGTLALKQTVDASGVRTLVQYDQSGHIAQQTVTQVDGSYVQSSYAADGALTGETTRHADGSRDRRLWREQQASQAPIRGAGHRDHMGAVRPGDDERDTAMRDLLAKLHCGARHAVQRLGSRHETRYSSRNHASARHGTLFLSESHPADVATQRAGDAVGDGLGMIPAAERQSGAIREIADSNERGIAITNDVQATVHGCELHQRCTAAPFLLLDIGSGEDLERPIGGTHTPCGRGAIRLPQQIEHLRESQGWWPAAPQPARAPANGPPE